MTRYLQEGWRLLAKCWPLRWARFVRHIARAVSVRGTWGKHPLLVKWICLIVITWNCALLMCDVPTPIDTITFLCSTEFSWSSYQVQFLKRNVALHKSDSLNNPCILTYEIWPNNIVHNSKSNSSWKVRYILDTSKTILSFHIFFVNAVVWMNGATEFVPAVLYVCIQ